MNTPFIVAEISANHLGSFSRAASILDAAAEAGADAIKLQCWTPGTMVGNPDLIIQSGPWAGRKMAELYEEAFTPWEWFRPLQEQATRLQIELFASAFDLKALEFLEELGVKRHKIASFELVDLELIQAAAKTGKPLILSTGMATLNEIWSAVTAVDDEADITLLHCVSAYPALTSEIGLSRLAHMEEEFFGCDIGLSDHTLGNIAAVTATILGATYIEKHLTLSREDGGPDSAFSCEPHEFASLVQDCRKAVQAIGKASYGPKDSELPQFSMRRSLWWAKDLKAGQTVSRETIKSARPALGLSPHLLPNIIGAILTKDVKALTPVKTFDFQ